MKPNTGLQASESPSRRSSATRKKSGLLSAEDRSSASCSAGHKPGRPRGFLLAKGVVLAVAFRWINDLFDEHDLNADERRVWFHVLLSGPRKPDAKGWVPLCQRLLRQEARAADMKRLLAAGLLERTGYSRAEKRSRAYRVPPCLAAEFLALWPGEGAPTFVDPFTGRKTSAKEKSVSRDDSRSLCVRAMKAIRVGYYHAEAVNIVVQQRRRAYEEANARLQDHRRRFDVAQAGEAEAEVNTLYGRYLVDRTVQEALLRQRTEYVGHGVWGFRPAYEPQSTGRVTDIGGRLQSATRELKKAAFSGFEPALGHRAYNYDLRSSQPRMLTGEFERAGIATGNLDLVLGSDKEAHARAVGVRVGTWKRGLMALVMGAGLFRSLEADLDRGSPRGELIKIFLREADEHELSGDALADAYGRFYERVRPLYEDLRAWRNWLCTAWLAARLRRGGPGCRRYVVNEAGARFWIDDHRANALPRKLAAFVLQGREAAFIHELTLLQDEFGFVVIANEHDGLVTVGPIPAEAIEQAKARTGLACAELVEKDFLG